MYLNICIAYIWQVLLTVISKRNMDRSENFIMKGHKRYEPLIYITDVISHEYK